MTHTAQYRRRFDNHDSLLLRSPDAVLSALPYLLGFTPHDSVVLLWIRRHRILLTQRIDMPDVGLDRDAWLDVMWSHRASGEADELIVILLTDRADVDEVGESILARAADAELSVRDALRFTGDRWWSLLCRDAACCGPEGRRVRPGVQAAIAAEFTLLGVAPMADREALVHALAADPAAVERVGPLVVAVLAAGGATGSAGPARETWRDSALTRIIALLGSDPADATDEDKAWLVAGLTDVRVRDTALWDTSQWEHDRLQCALTILTEALRSAPQGIVAPVATCCAAVAWLVGDGARALIADERALLDDADYSLAILLLQSLQAGLPPDAWRQALATVPRDECRYGSSRPRRRSRSA